MFMFGQEIWIVDIFLSKEENSLRGKSWAVSQMVFQIRSNPLRRCLFVLIEVYNNIEVDEA